MLSLWLVLFVVWMVANSTLAIEVALLGVVITLALAYVFTSTSSAWRQIRWTPAGLYHFLAYSGTFLVELVKAGRLKIEPVDGEPLEACPKCGNGVLQLREGQYGAFHGCSRFPACDYKHKARQESGPSLRPAGRTQRIQGPVKTGDQCPVCRRGIIEQKDGRNGPFLGCSRYREGCRATANTL